LGHLLELLGKGLDGEFSEILRPYYWEPVGDDLSALRRRADRAAEPEPALQLGLALLREGCDDEAIDQLRAAANHWPERRDIALALAAGLADTGQTRDALQALDQANRCGADQPGVMLAIGLACEKLDMYARAREAYLAAVAGSESCPAARQRLAAMALRDGRPGDAAEQYLALRQAEPQDGWTRTALGHLLFRAGRFAEAVEEFESAIVMEPENWAMVDDEVEALIAENRLTEATDRLKGLIRQQGPFADLHVRLADLYSQTGDDEQALENYRLALDLQPGYLEATVKLGTHHLVCGRWSDAAEAFYLATELNDRVLANYVGMGVSQAALGKQEEAMNSFDLAAAVEPNSTLLLSETARLQLKSELSAELGRSFENGNLAAASQISLDSDYLLQRQIDAHLARLRAGAGDPEVGYRLGVLLRQVGRLAEARDQFAQTVERAPGFAMAAIKLGITLQELGMVEQAVARFEQAMKPDEACIDYHYRLGLLHTDREQFLASIRSLEADGADSEDLRANLALSLQCMGLMDRAAATWRSLCRIHHAGT
jgi:tetratricopeptide (TPR) repeat protein